MEHGDEYFAVEVAEGTPTVLTARGELDAATSPALQDAIDGAGATDLALDLAAVSFIDSSGLRTITAARREADESGRTFEVVAASDAVRRVFEMTGLGSLLAG